MKYKLDIAYDGSNYGGMQSQLNVDTIQDEIEKAIKIIFKQDIKILFASRTDSGVHAYHQILTFITNTEMNPYKLKGSFNGILPKDIHVNDVEIVSDEFNCRYNVAKKTYRYLINYKEYSPFLINKAYQCHYDLDVNLMKKAALKLLGEHDFSSFNTSTYEEKPDQVRTIYSLDIKEEDNLLIIEISGNGFLRNMVRIIVGTLLEIGRGLKDSSVIDEMLSKPSKDTKRYNIDALGLYLVSIEYK